MKTNIALCLTVVALAVTPLGRAQTPPADSNTNTSNTILLTVAGQVELARPANPNWVAARTNQVLEAGMKNSVNGIYCSISERS